MENPTFCPRKANLTPQKRGILRNTPTPHLPPTTRKRTLKSTYQFKRRKN
ncbi:hypothetical protein Avbf_19070 [Armadillidium vulgare]|nr:hypothetical protein Avbf_19070 [Armadillidium vulgare]